MFSAPTPLTNNTSAFCPQCGAPIELSPHPNKPNVLIGICKCNVNGPVLEQTITQVASEDAAPDEKEL